MAQGNNIEWFTAVGYVRISDADQSNFSIEGQKSNLLDFCKRFKVNLQQVFTDDGRSGANFDREGWRDLEQTVKSSRKKITLFWFMLMTGFHATQGNQWNLLIDGLKHINAASQMAFLNVAALRRNKSNPA